MSSGALTGPMAGEDANAILERMIAELKLVTDATESPIARSADGPDDGTAAEPAPDRPPAAPDAARSRDDGAGSGIPEPARSAGARPSPPEGERPAAPVRAVADGIAPEPPAALPVPMGGGGPEARAERTPSASGEPTTEGPAPDGAGRAAGARPSESRHSQAIVEWDRLDDGLSRFNPLDLLTIPPAGSARRQYLGEVASILVADGSDETSIVVKTRRLVCALCEVAVARTESTTGGGSPASLPQVAEWVETHLVEPGSATVDAAAMAAERAASMTAAIAALTDVEAGTARRGRAALLALRSDPRSHDVIALAMEALEPFQEDVLRRITETSDFGPGNFESEDHGAPTFRVQAVRTSDLGRMLTRLMHACLTISLDTAGPRQIDVITSYRGPNGTRRIQDLG